MSKEALKKIGKNLKHYRRAVGFRQTDIADISGVAYRHYQDIEAGKVNVSIDTLVRLSKPLRVSLEQLVAGAE